MADHVIAPPPRAALAVAGGGTFPIRRVFCVGRNYAAHAREMGHDDREPPFFFLKPADAVVPGADGAHVPFPPMTDDLHHEIELCVLVGRGGADLAPDAVADHLWGAAAGVDLTRRDLQAQAKAKGRPWDMGKGFDAAAPMAPAVPLRDAPPLDRGRIWLTVNGERRQEADLAAMIWPVRDHVAELSRYVALAPGDVVMTGTPEGVGRLERGDRVVGGVDGLPGVDFTLR